MGDSTSEGILQSAFSETFCLTRSLHFQSCFINVSDFLGHQKGRPQDRSHFTGEGGPVSAAIWNEGKSGLVLHPGKQGDGQQQKEVKGQVSPWRTPRLPWELQHSLGTSPSTCSPGVVGLRSCPGCFVSALSDDKMRTCVFLRTCPCTYKPRTASKGGRRGRRSCCQGHEAR